jgi:hypothetical protein
VSGILRDFSQSSQANVGVWKQKPDKTASLRNLKNNLFKIIQSRIRKS